MKKYIVILATLVMLLAFASCGSNHVYSDGTYTGTGKVDITSDEGNINYDVTADLTVKDGVITDLVINAGETNDDVDTMIKKAVDTYVSTDGSQEVAEVDSIAGATVSHDAIMDAIDDALSQAKK